jgi:hypothetical protein
MYHCQIYRPKIRCRGNLDVKRLWWGSTARNLPWLYHQHQSLHRWWFTYKLGHILYGVNDTAWIGQRRTRNKNMTTTPAPNKKNSSTATTTNKKKTIKASTAINSNNNNNNNRRYCTSTLAVIRWFDLYFSSLMHLFLWRFEIYLSYSFASLCRENSPNDQIKPNLFLSIKGINISSIWIHSCINQNIVSGGSIWLFFLLS